MYAHWDLNMDAKNENAAFTEERKNTFPNTDQYFNFWISGKKKKKTGRGGREELVAPVKAENKES